LELNAENQDGFHSAPLYLVLSYVPWYFIMYYRMELFWNYIFKPKLFEISALLHSSVIIVPGIAFSITTWKGFGIKSCKPRRFPFSSHVLISTFIYPVIVCRITIWKLFRIINSKPRRFPFSASVHSSTVISPAIASILQHGKCLELKAVNQEIFQSAPFYIFLQLYPLVLYSVLPY